MSGVIVLPPDYIGTAAAFDDLARVVPQAGEMPPLPDEKQPATNAAPEDDGEQTVRALHSTSYWAQHKARMKEKAPELLAWRERYSERLRLADEALRQALRSGALVAYSIEGEAAGAYQQTGTFDAEYWGKPGVRWYLGKAQRELLDDTAKHLAGAALGLERDKWETWRTDFLANPPWQSAGVSKANGARARRQHGKATPEEYASLLTEMMQRIHNMGPNLVPTQKLARAFCERRLGKARFGRNACDAAYGDHPETQNFCKPGPKGGGRTPDLETLLNG